MPKPTSDLFSVSTTESFVELPIAKFHSDLNLSDFLNQANKDRNYSTREENHYKGYNRIKSIKKTVKEIKSQYPAYPVFKCYKSIIIQHDIDKNSKDNGDTKKDQDHKCDKDAQDEYDKVQDSAQLWIEKYKARNTGQIIGNQKSVTALKKWLESWSNSGNNNRMHGCDSGTEFEDTDSCDNIQFSNNVIVLNGPNGCGKTTTVYAICNELSLNVLEVNASSKRTGKWLIQELQEATQSHQVHKEKNVVPFNRDQTYKNVKPKKSKNLSGTQRPHSCVLLVEDIDVIFDQDDGFIAALLQIIPTSKRPIIITTTDIRSNFLEKFTKIGKVINFSPLTSKVLGVWLQLICLIEERLHLKDELVAYLLNSCNGDVRRCLLELQLHLTGYKDVIQETSLNSISENVTLDSNQCLVNIVDRQEILNLEGVWWNVPNICKLPDFSKLRGNQNFKREEQVNADIKFPSANYRKNLYDLFKLFDDLAFIDCIREKRCYDGLRPKSITMPKDSLELIENISEYEGSEFVSSLGSFLINGRFERYLKRSGMKPEEISMTVHPSTAEKR